MTESNTPSSFELVSQNLKSVLGNQAELAKAELGPAAKNAAIGSGMFGTAGVFALHALWMLLLSAALAVGWLYVSVTGLGPWGSFTLGFLTVAVLSLLIAGLLALIGVRRFKRVKKPEATIAELQKTVAELQAALKKRPGSDRVDLVVISNETVA